MTMGVLFSPELAVNSTSKKEIKEINGVKSCNHKEINGKANGGCFRLENISPTILSHPRPHRKM